MSLSLSPSHSVEVFIVDTPRAANVALGVPPADAESTHVLCRHADESTPDFTCRVLRRIERIQRTRRVRSLWYVVGVEAVRRRPPVPPLQALLPLLEGGSSLTIVGPGSHQSTVFEWIDSLVQRRTNVDVRAQFYTDGAETRALVDPLRTTHVRTTGQRPAALPSLARTGPWFPLEPGAAVQPSEGAERHAS